MKKTSLFKIVLLLNFIFCLTACSKSEFVNLSSFIYNFNYQTQFDTLSFDEFYYSQEDSTDIYTAFFSEVEGEYLMLQIVQSEQMQIQQCSITFSKIDENDEPRTISEQTQYLFEMIVQKTIEAFTLNDSDFSSQILLDFMLDSELTYTDEGELSKQESNFYYLYISNSIANEFVIYNTWLSPQEDVEKAQSNAAYDNTTDIRDGTVALK